MKSETSQERWLVVLLCAVPAVLYLATLRFEFVYDDHSQIVSNPLVQTWKSLPLLFTTDVWRFQNPLVVGNYWRPMFMLWLMINHSLFGFKAAGWHAASVLVHIGCTYLVYRLAVRLSRDRAMAFIAALLFALHPSHLETVAWISGATDSLMCLFLLGSLLLFISGSEAQTKKWLYFALSIVLYLTAVLTKETAIVGPAFIFFYVLLFGERGPAWPKRIAAGLLASGPFVAASIVYLVQRHAALHGFSHPYLKMPWLDVLITVPSVLWFYLRHLVWPVALSVVYDAVPVVHRTWSNFWGPLLGCVLLAAALIGYLLRTRDRGIAFAALMLALPLLPVLYIPALESETFLHDRYLYLPSIGLAMIVATILRRVRWGEGQLFGVPAAQAAAAATLIVASAIATASQEIYWANDILLFGRAVTIAPGSAGAFNSLGTALAARGRMKEAMFAFEQVIKRNPDSWVAQYNVGLGYFLDGRYAEAEPHLEKAVELYPVAGDPAAVLAESQIRQGKYAEGEEAIRHAISVMPYKAGYRRVLAQALEGEGKPAEALTAALEEVKKHPDDEQAQAIVERLSPKSVKTDSFSPRK